MNNPAAAPDARWWQIYWAAAPASAVRLLAAPLEKRKRGERKIKGPPRQHLLFSVSLSAPSSQLAAPLAREMSDLKVCVLCASTQIRRVPDLGRMNNYLEMCASEPPRRQQKVGQRVRISATGCENWKF